jgi:hypothetical protein
MSEQAFFLPVFGSSCALSVFILVLTNLSLWVDAIGELLSNSDHGWGRLLERYLALSLPIP